MARKMRIEAGLILFGIILLSAGFLKDNTSQIPFVLEIVAPDYINGIKAFDNLRELNSCITEKDRGFSVLNKLILQELKIEYEQPPDIKIVKICHIIKKDTILWSNGIEFFPLEVTTDKGEVGEILDGNFLKNFLEKIREDSLFVFAEWLFIFGVISELLALILILRENESEQH